MSETKLKPCPFCGGEARIEHLPWCFDSAVICNNCYARITDEPLLAIKAWNTRKPMDNIVSELEKESDFFGGEPMGSLQKAYYCKGIEKAIDIVRGGAE